MVVMFDGVADIFGVDILTVRRAALAEIIIWIVMFIAVMVDMRAGIRKARALKLPIDSHGLRRTFTKFGDYGKVTALFMCVDVLGLLFGIWSMPYASAVSAVIAVYRGVERAGESPGGSVVGSEDRRHRG